MHFIQRLKLTKRTALYGLGIGLGVFLLSNVSIWFFYRNHTYPNSQVANTQIGSKKTSELASYLQKLSLLPSKVELSYEKSKSTLSPNDLGIRINTSQITRDLTKRHWLPVYNFMTPHNAQLEITTNDTKLQQAIDTFANKHKQDPIDARPTLQNGLFTLAPAVPGKVIDTDKAKRTVVTAIMAGRKTITMPSSVTKPTINDQQVKPVVDTLQAQQKIVISYTYQGKTTKPTAIIIGSWYDEAAGIYTLNDTKIRAYITTLGTSYGISVQNISDAVTATKKAIETTKPLTLALTAVPRTAKVYTYCTAVKGVDPSNLPAFEAKLASTYQDARGWNLDGRISYVKSSGRCNFTVWLSAADQVPSFGAVCDNIWSCTVSPNVIINFDRWQNASPAWNGAGGALADYRSMVINHETGHWLGFGHKFCGGAGQAAPVMQQQSISLQGCSFNPWPSAGEREQLRQRLKL